MRHHGTASGFIACVAMWMAGACGPQITASSAGGDGDGDEASSADDAADETSDDDTNPGDATSDATADDDGSSDSGPPPVEVTRCPEIVAESMYCATSDSVGRIVVVGGDTGASCVIGEPDLPHEHLEPSLVWDGDRIIGCSGPSLVRIDLATDVVVSGASDCNKVATGDGLLILEVSTDPDAPGPAVRRYADFEAAVAGTPDATFPAIPYWTAAASSGDVLFVVGSNTVSITRYALGDLSPLGELAVTMEGVPTGMSELDGALFLLTTDEFGVHRLARYNPISGERQWSLQLDLDDGFHGGLACRTGV